MTMIAPEIIEVAARAIQGEYRRSHRRRAAMLQRRARTALDVARGKS